MSRPLPGRAGERGFLAALRGFVPTAALLVAILLIWEVGVALAGWPSYLLPRPTAVAQRLAADPGFFLTQGSVTLAEALVGLALGVGGAFVIGAAMAHWRPLERALLPLAIVVKVTPSHHHCPAAGPLVRLRPASQGRHRCAADLLPYVDRHSLRAAQHRPHEP